MYKKYLQVKADNPGCIVFVRIGDFYETFGEDAQLVGEKLNIVVASRKLGGQLTPMAGVPYFSAKKYFMQLIEAGVKAIAVIEPVNY